MKHALDVAKTAQEQLVKDGMKLLKQLPTSDHSLFQTIKTGITKSNATIQALDHMMMWKEMIDGSLLSREVVENMLFDIADATKKFNTSIGMGKGQLRAEQN